MTDRIKQWIELWDDNSESLKDYKNLYFLRTIQENITGDITDGVYYHIIDDKEYLAYFEKNIALCALNLEDHDEYSYIYWGVDRYLNCLKRVAIYKNDIMRGKLFKIEDVDIEKILVDLENNSSMMKKQFKERYGDG